MLRKAIHQQCRWFDRASLINLNIENLTIKDDDNPDHKESIITFSIGIPLTLF